MSQPPVNDRQMLHTWARGMLQAANPEQGVYYPSLDKVRPLERVVDWFDRNVDQQSSARDAVQALRADQPSLQTDLNDTERATLDDLLRAFDEAHKHKGLGSPMTAFDLRYCVGKMAEGARQREDPESVQLLQRIHDVLDFPENTYPAAIPAADAVGRLRQQAPALEQGLSTDQVDKMREMVETVALAPEYPAWGRGQSFWVEANTPQVWRSTENERSVDKFVHQDGRTGDGQVAPAQTDTAPVARPAHRVSSPAAGAARTV